MPDYRSKSDIFRDNIVAIKVHLLYCHRYTYMVLSGHFVHQATKIQTRWHKVYTQILLRESYRERGENGSKVKKRTLLNLTKYPEAVIKTIELALKHKNSPGELEHLLGGSAKQTQGRSVGAVWVLLHVCRDLGLDKIIGSSRHGLLCLWMVMARLIEQGSRLSAVRLADEHAVCELLGVDPFTEDELYQALDWLCEQQNRYLAEHPRADEFTAIRKVWERQGKLKVGDFLKTTCKNRSIAVQIDEAYLTEVQELDGWYVLKTDLPAKHAPMEIVHDRYKDLIQVEQAFRTCKTGHLEVRPIYVRKESRTRGQVFVVMLAYLVRRKLAKAWRDLDMTVEEGLKKLSTLCALEHEINGSRPGGMLSIPQPRPRLARLFSALAITPPSALPRHGGRVGSRKKLADRIKAE